MASISLVSIAFLGSVILGCSLGARAQSNDYTTEAASPMRFSAVHGRMALLAGNPSAGLEAWAYPLQIFNGYKPEFHYADAASAIPSGPLLRRIEVAPTFVERTYLGADFTIHERLFVPRDLPGVRITYTVDGPRPIEILVHFKPVLDLMWPVSVGGQQVLWQPSHNAYRLDEPTRRFMALVGSPDAVLHDDLPNTNAPLTNDPQLTLTLRPVSDGKAVSVVMACDPANAQATASLYRRMTDEAATLEAASAASYREAEATTLHLETPDAEVNKALAWSSIALDQAWVCNPTLGCGLVAGYGPSRGLARRPQYDWFFAGDALLTIRSLVLSSNFERAREALLFLMKYQSAANGMMWHELSQSASYVDWAGSYPYMFPHVDITFDYLSTLQRYVEASGDQQLIRDHWSSIEAAYRYCESILDAADGLPRVPRGKEGGDEQGQPREELALATAWISAAESYAKLAAATGHQDAVVTAHRASQRAAAAIPGRFWDAKKNFWIAGFSQTGAPQGQMRSRPLEALALPVFSAEQSSSVLDTLSTSQFQTDWGTRGVGSLSPGFKPASYASGSVWATSTAEAAAILWQQHRPLAAWTVWRTLLPWLTLDAMGHLHETLSGLFFQPQEESVPEQTWSSAMFLSSFVQGMLGVEQDQLHHRLRLAPHLPAEWDHIAVSNLRVGETRVQFNITRSAEDEALDLRLEGSGPVLDLDYAPSLPLGAHLLSVTVDGKPVLVPAERQGDDLLVRIPVALSRGAHTVHVAYRDGIEAIVPVTAPVLGQTSRGLRMIHASAEEDSYTLVAEIHNGAGNFDPPANIVILNTRRQLNLVSGGRLLDHIGTRYRIALEPDQGMSSVTGSEYVRATLRVSFSKDGLIKSRTTPA